MNHSGIRDSGARLQIVPSTRKIAVPSANRVIGIVGDCNSEELTIQCPKIIDGHDIEGCASHYVTWVNVNGEKGHDHLEILKVDNETETIYFGWVIRGATTTTAGIVSFSIHFEDYSEGYSVGEKFCTECGNPILNRGRVIYRWSTTECTECEVLDCVNAPLGTYESVFVDEDTLYIADHTPVMDETLMLQTPGIVPSGQRYITTNGIHGVAEFASVNVAIPNDKPIALELQPKGVVMASDGTSQNTKYLQLEAPKIAVTEGGIITASANGLETEYTLSADDDPDFVSENIVAMKNIFGVGGTAIPNKMQKYTATLDITNVTVYDMEVMYQQVIDDRIADILCTVDKDGSISSSIVGNLEKTIEVNAGSWILFSINESVTYLNVRLSVNGTYYYAPEDGFKSAFTKVENGRRYAMVQIPWYGVSDYSDIQIIVGARKASE